MQELVSEVSKLLTARAWKLSTAESCTGGGVAFYLTEMAGSSAWFERGFVTYSNLAKIEMLGVKTTTLEKYGAVSEETVREMAEGALKHSQTEVSLAITGIAGPDGGTKEKPVGTVWFAWAGITFATQTIVKKLNGNRQEIREQAIFSALQELLLLIK